MAEMRDKVKGAIDDAAQKGKDFTDRAANAADANRGGNPGQGTAQAAVNAASDYANQARDKVQQWAGDAGDVAKQAGQRVQQWAGDAYDQMPQSFGEFGSEVSSMVRRYPIPALLVGFGVGLLLGRAART